MRRPLRWLQLVVVLAVVAGPMSAAGATQGRTAQDRSGTAGATLDDDDLGWGETTTVRGTGWLPGSTVQVILYAGAIVLAEPQADDDGSWRASVRAPELGSSPDYRIAVQGTGSDNLIGYAELPLTIRGPVPSVSIDDDDLGWGSTTTVRGERYKPGEKVTVSLFPDNRVLGEGVAGSDQRIAVPIEIPSGLLSSRDYQLAVTGQGIDRLFHFDTIAIVIIGDRPAVRISNRSPGRGGRLVVTGERFSPAQPVEVSLLPGYEDLAEVTPADDGTFSTEVTIPEDAFAPDPHQLVVTGFGLDGLFAYLTANVSLDERVASGGPVDLVLDPDTTERGPELRRRSTRTSVEDRDRRSAGGGIGAIAVLAFVLLLLLVLLASQKDVRRRVLERVRPRR